MVDLAARMALTAKRVPPSDPCKITSQTSVSPKRLAISSAAVPVGGVSVGIPVLVNLGLRHFQKEDDCWDEESGVPMLPMLESRREGAGHFVAIQ